MIGKLKWNPAITHNHGLGGGGKNIGTLRAQKLKIPAQKKILVYAPVKKQQNKKWNIDNIRLSMLH